MHRLGGRPPVTVPMPTPSGAPRWRRWTPTLALVALVASAAATIARAAISPAAIAPAEDVAAEIHAPTGRALIPELAAPVPTVSPEPFVSPIEIVLPPPPPPRSQTATSTGVTTTTAWCDGTYGATASASSTSGLLAAVNAERSRWGLRALTWNDSLASTAQRWSETQASENNLYHGDTPSPGGQNVYYVSTSRGLSESSAAARAHSAWMTSPGHCKNILNSGWRSLGAGAASADGGYTWFLTENFQ